MSEHNGKQKQASGKEGNKAHQDKGGVAQGAETADPSSLKKEIDATGQRPNPQKKASGSQSLSDKR